MLTTYSLNFVEIVLVSTLQSLHPIDVSVKFTAVHTTSISGFVAMYQHLQNKELRAISFAHGIHLVKTRLVLLKNLLRHDCGADCSRMSSIFLFSIARKVCEGAVRIHSIEKVRAEERARR